MQHPSEIEYRNRSENEFGKVSVIKMSKKLVAYFSASGVTAKLAKTLALLSRQICTKLYRRKSTHRQTLTGQIKKAVQALR